MIAVLTVAAAAVASEMWSASGAAGELEARSLVADSLSCQGACAAARRAEPCGFEERGAASSCSAAMSWVAEDGEGAGRREKGSAAAGRTGKHAAEACFGSEVVETGNTWTAGDAAAAAGRRCSGAGHVERARAQMQVSWTAVCGMTSGGSDGV